MPSALVEPAYRTGLAMSHLDFSTHALTMDFSRLSNGFSMTYATAAPATAGGQAGSPVRESVFASRTRWWPKASQPAVCFPFCASAPYLIDSIASDAFLFLFFTLTKTTACLPELHHKHHPALAPR